LVAAAMFAKTLSVGLTEVAPHKIGAVLACSEVRQPGTAQGLRAASTAGALLAGYFPHLRGAFRFPPHLAGKPGDVSQCSASQQNPKIASLLSHELLAEKPALDLLKTGSQTRQPEYSGKNKTPLPGKSNAPAVDIEPVRPSVSATLMATEYGPKMEQLEKRCMGLYVLNQQFQVDAKKAHTCSEKTRELNRKLCREMTESRSERNSVTEELDRLRQLLNLSRKQVEQVQCENSTLSGALEASQLQVLELSSKSASESSQVDLLDQSTSTDDMCRLGHEVEAEPMETNAEEHIQFEAVTCKCNNHTSWGCDLHRVYSGGLLLAHRETASRISRGPPGLEIQAPPGLESMLAGVGRVPYASALHMVPA